MRIAAGKRYGSDFHGENEDEDPRIREIYEAELRKKRVPLQMSEFTPAD